MLQRAFSEDRALVTMTMPPKKQNHPHGKAVQKDAASQLDRKEEAEKNELGNVDEANDQPKPAIPAKRKKDQSSQTGSQKAPRRSGRGKSKREAAETLGYLLSPESLKLCRPKDEVEDLEHRGNIKTYSESELNPFEELISAIILSRPISHALGVRTIRTILNDPYKFTTPKAILDAGGEKVLKSLWDARTQHKDKTAEQLSLAAKVITEEFANGDSQDTSLKGVREQAAKKMHKESELLTSNVKGIGKTGMSIFFRRIQWLWDECYPYIDERTSKALQELGIPHDAEGLAELIANHWGDLEGLVPHNRNDDVKKRRAFVVALERAVGADLEKNLARILEQVGSS